MYLALLFFVGDATVLGLSSIVYESKSIPLDIYSDLQLPNLFQHLSSLVPLMQNSLQCDQFAPYLLLH